MDRRLVQSGFENRLYRNDRNLHGHDSRAAPGQRGNLSSGYNWFIRMRPGNTDGKLGRIEAFNLQTGKSLWIDHHRAPDTTCTLDTAGGVVFEGSFDRFLHAYDDATGAELWKIRMNDVPEFLSHHVQRRRQGISRASSSVRAARSRKLFRRWFPKSSLRQTTARPSGFSNYQTSIRQSLRINSEPSSFLRRARHAVPGADAWHRDAHPSRLQEGGRPAQFNSIPEIP